MSERIDITGGHVRISEEDHHSSRELQHLKRIEHLLEMQTKLLHQILAREPNWYPRTTSGAITVK